MRRRRIFKCALTLMLLLGIFWGEGITALAAAEVTVQVKDVSVSPGKTVTTELIMGGTFAAFQGLLVYDTNALTLEKIEATSALSGSMTMFNQDEITDEFKDGSFVSASANNAEINGAVITFTFRAGSNANGTYSFSISQFLVYDENGTELIVNAVDIPVERPGNYSTPTEEATQGGSNQEGSTQEGTNQEEITSQGGTSQEETTTPVTNTSGADSNNLDSDRSGGGLVILLIILALAAVIIALAVVRAKKKNNQIEDPTEDQEDQVEDSTEDQEGQTEDQIEDED